MARLFFLGSDEIKMEMSSAFLIFLMKYSTYINV